jgi:hypothetical protein
MRRWVSGHRAGSIQPIHCDPSAPDTISLGEFGETIDPPLADQTLTAAGGFAAGGALNAGGVAHDRRLADDP